MPRTRTRGLATLVAAAALAAASAACGDEENAPGAPPGVPAAGENTPLTTPGVPVGASYDIDGRHWSRLGIREQFEVALDYIDDNETGRCEDVRIADVVGYANESLGYDFDATTPISEVLAEGCDASRQSG